MSMRTVASPAFGWLMGGAGALFQPLLLTSAYAYASIEQGAPLPRRPPAGPHAGDPPRSIPNPLAIHGPAGDLLLVAASAINTFLAPVLIAPAALAVRFRRSCGVDREQLKWLMFTAAVAFGLLFVAFANLPLTVASTGPRTTQHAPSTRAPRDSATRSISMRFGPSSSRS